MAWRWPGDKPPSEPILDRVLSIGILRTNLSENFSEIHICFIKENAFEIVVYNMTAFFPRTQCVNPEARRNVPEPSRNQSDAESFWLVPDRFQPLQAVLGNIYANIYFTPTHHRHLISRSYGARYGAYPVRNSENIRRPITTPSNTCIYKICNPIYL